MTPLEEYRTIQLTKGQVAKVSPEDYGFLSQFKWYAQRERKGNFYAFRTVNGKVWKMHRCVSGALEGYFTDHINHDTLDNRRSNLRIVTRSENGQNRQLSKNNTSGYPGVSYQKQKASWRAKVSINGKILSKDGFQSAELAYAFRETYLKKQAESHPSA